jgi:hypothetical protein
LAKDSAFGLDEFDEFGLTAADQVAYAIAKESQGDLEFRKAGGSSFHGDDIAFQDSGRDSIFIELRQ